MYQFEPGVLKTATVPLTNTGLVTFDYHTVIYLGVNQVAMAESEDTIGGGQTVSVILPVTMPAVAGVYPVYLSVFSGGNLVRHLRASQDVEILAVATQVEFQSAVVYDFYYQATYNSAWEQWFYQAVVKVDYQFTAQTDPRLYGQIGGAIKLKNAAGVELTGSYVTTGGMAGPDDTGYYFPSSGYGTWPYTGFPFGGEILLEMIGALTWELELVAYDGTTIHGQRTFTGICQGLGQE